MDVITSITNPRIVANAMCKLLLACGRTNLNAKDTQRFSYPATVHASYSYSYCFPIHLVRSSTHFFSFKRSHFRESDPIRSSLMFHLCCTICRSSGAHLAAVLSEAGLEASLPHLTTHLRSLRHSLAPAFSNNSQRKCFGTRAHLIHKMFMNPDEIKVFSLKIRKCRHNSAVS